MWTQSRNIARGAPTRYFCMGNAKRMQTLIKAVSTGRTCLSGVPKRLGIAFVGLNVLVVQVTAAEKPIGDISLGMSRPKDPPGTTRRELPRDRVIELNRQIRPIFIAGDSSAKTPLPVSWWV